MIKTIFDLNKKKGPTKKHAMICKTTISLSVYFFICAVLFASCSTPQPKEKTLTLREEYSEPWTEFWDSFDMKDKTTLDIIQTINEHNIDLYEYHYKKESSVSKGKFLIALKNSKTKKWNYYFVWTDTHKMEGISNKLDLEEPTPTNSQ